MTDSLARTLCSVAIRTVFTSGILFPVSLTLFGVIFLHMRLLEQYRIINAAKHLLWPTSSFLDQFGPYSVLSAIGVFALLGNILQNVVFYTVVGLIIGIVVYIIRYPLSRAE